MVLFLVKRLLIRNNNAFNQHCGYQKMYIEVNQPSKLYTVFFKLSSLNNIFLPIHAQFWTLSLSIIFV